MPDYQRMYYILFDEMSKAIEILQNAQCKTEEIYSSATDAINEDGTEAQGNTTQFPSV